MGERYLKLISLNIETRITTSTIQLSYRAIRKGCPFSVLQFVFHRSYWFSQILINPLLVRH